MNFKTIFGPLIQLGWLSYLLLPTSVAALPKEHHKDEVVAHLEGIMDTSAQAAADADAVNVRMTTCRVKLAEQPNSTYLYQEQALSENLERPYRQRFLKISTSENGKIVISQSHKSLQPKTVIGLCSRPLEQRVISVKQISEPICQVFLKPLINVYVGNTQPGGCPTNFRGASRITNHIVLHEQGMDTWDRGFDAQGNQVWGAKENSYQFRWLENKKYTTVLHAH